MPSREMNNTNIENIALKFVILLIFEYNIFKNFGNWIYKVEVRKCSNLVKHSLPKLNGFELSQQDVNVLNKELVH